jgi:ABC-type oligopeptide transport system substrate-binding subunit
MKNLSKKALSLVVALTVLLVAGCSESSAVDKPKYREEQYREEPHTMKDGTRCVIIRGGSYSGIVGITCNYGS